MASGGELSTCRSQLIEVLDFIDNEDLVVPEALMRLVDESRCSRGHALRYAAIQELVEADSAGLYRLSPRGVDWLIENGQPPSSWADHINGYPPLRPWQQEALDAWAEHGRHGVVEAVTGTGKSRVGVEAAREARRQGFSVVIAVPTIDLVDQWLKVLQRHGLPEARALSAADMGQWRAGGVIVSTVQSLYIDPPRRADGRVLLIADECHRYGAGRWRQLLSPIYRRRLGLTATFERNDDGLETLKDYFGGEPVYEIGFARAIAEGAIAPYDVKLLSVSLTHAERRAYDQAQETLGDCRMRLIAAGFPSEPFGAFLHEVEQAADENEDPTVSEVARRYLKAFADRIAVLAGARAKVDAAASLSKAVQSSNGTLLFTRRIEAAEDICEAMTRNGVRATAIHSQLPRGERKDRLAALRSGRVQAVVAPTVLDEGIDVPDVDLGIVLSGSKSRRQMIQRMGRVLRKKRDGRSATFVVVYAENTVEDLNVSDGQQGCLDLITEAATSVEQLKLESAHTWTPRGRTAAAPVETLAPEVGNSGSVPHERAEPVVTTDESKDVDRGALKGAPEVASVRETLGEQRPVEHSTFGENVVDALERLARLKENGLLTDEEFAAAKRRLLF